MPRVRTSIILATALLTAALPAPADAAESPACTAAISAAAATGALADRMLALVEAKDLPAVRALLPELQRKFATIPPSPRAGQRCGEVVAIYDRHLYARYTQKKDYWGRRPPSPFPAGSKYEFRDPRSVDLAYAIARADYALDDRAGADAALARGLLIAPRDHKLTTERLVYWIDQGRWREIDTLLGGFFYPHEPDLTDRETATFSAIAAQARVKLGNWNGARLSLGTADLLDPGNGYAAMVRKEFEAMPVPPPKPVRARAPRRSPRAPTRR